MRIVSFFLLTLLFWGFTGKTLWAEPEFSVNSIRIGIHDGETRLVLDVSQKANFRAFMLQNPSRLVIDLPSFQWRAPLPRPLAGSLVGTIRNGILQPGISRIVVDLSAPATLKNAFFIPKSPGLSDRLVIDFLRAGPGYDVAKEKMFGTLNSASTQAPPTEVAQPAKNTSYEVGQTRPIQSSGKKPLIVIDPGHGGQDPGSIGAQGQKEKDVTLGAAKELKRQLEATGRYRVHLTRSTDVFIKLQERVAIGRRNGGDLFISLHADSIDKPNVGGASVYTLSNKASDAQTAKLAAKENQADLIAGVDLSHEDKQVANILIDLAMRDTMNQSKYFANTVVRQASNKGVRLLEKPHRFAGFAVLKAPDVPSVLIEMGFMSNPKEVAQLTSQSYREKIAKMIVSGVDQYFDKVNKNGQK